MRYNQYEKKFKKQPGWAAAPSWKWTIFSALSKRIRFISVSLSKKLNEFKKLLPWHRALTDVDICKIIEKTSLSPIFRGVFSRDEFINRVDPPLQYECGVVNLDSASGPGSHWTCYFKLGFIIHYYDSFGNLPPPIEFVNFFDKLDIYYNWSREQEYNTLICGHLCLCFLFKQYTTKKKNLKINV